MESQLYGSKPDGKRLRRRVCADDLEIAGLVPVSTQDWPGRIVATVFCQGCPWKCFYCHNPELQDSRTKGTVAFSEVRKLLRRRQGLLDGVVFTGGEATRQASLVPAIREVHAIGFDVGLHTAGAYPQRLQSVLPVVDWVGLDIKALPVDYEKVAGRISAGSRAWQSLSLVIEQQKQQPGLELEVRTTVSPASPAAVTAVEIASKCLEMGVTRFALQQARPEGTLSEFEADAPGWDDEFRRLCGEIESLGFTEFIARPR